MHTWALGEVFDWIDTTAPDLRDLELGTGGYWEAPHCDLSELLAGARARERLVSQLGDRGFQLSALNVSGNPLEQPVHATRYAAGEAEASLDCGECSAIS